VQKGRLEFLGTRPNFAKSGQSKTGRRLSPPHGGDEYPNCALFDARAGCPISTEPTMVLSDTSENVDDPNWLTRLTWGDAAKRGVGEHRCPVSGGLYWVLSISGANYLVPLIGQFVGPS